MHVELMVFYHWPAEQSPQLKLLLGMLPAAVPILTKDTGLSPTSARSPFVGGIPEVPTSEGASLPPPTAATTCSTSQLPVTTPTDQNVWPATDQPLIFSPSDLQVGFRLSLFEHAWKEIGASEAVCTIVKGTELEFDSSPILMHPCSSPDSSKGIPDSKVSLLHQEVQTLLQKKAIEYAPAHTGFYAHISLMPKKKC